MINKTCAALPLCAIAIVSFSFVKKSKPAAKKSEPLVFPVAGRQNNVGSFWGDPRGDGGERKHEGIDIFAKKGTPVVAVADGEILSNHSTPLGGKVLWLQPTGKVWTAYYAHLDKQLVKEGDHVRKGQMIGTVGNTGNARTTPAHLHFGIYTWQGAVDPYPAVQNARKIISPVQPGGKPELLAGNKHKTGKTKEKKRPSTDHVAKRSVHATRSTPADRSVNLYVNNRANLKSTAGKQCRWPGKRKKTSGRYVSFRIVPSDKRKVYVYMDGK